MHKNDLRDLPECSTMTLTLINAIHMSVLQKKKLNSLITFEGYTDNREDERSERSVLLSVSNDTELDS